MVTTQRNWGRTAGTIARFPERVRRAFGAELERERERWFLWLPVGLGIGIAIYFALPIEPPLLIGAAVLAVVGLIMTVGRRYSGLLAAVLIILAVAGGFTVAQWRTAMVDAPMLDRRLGPVTVNGRVVRVETQPKALRLTMDRLQISRLAANHTPQTVRIRAAGAQPTVAPGDWIAVRAVLNPPPAPAAPGAFDFQRQSYFRQLGAVGFSMGALRIVAPAGTTGTGSLAIGLARLRQDIAARVRDGLPGTKGAVAAALMTGDRGAIPEPVMEAIRDSGLAHLLAISGLHIGLVAGILFVGLRAGLSLVPPIALRHPIKKWAASVAIVGALGYAVVAGATVPTQRAFLMIGLVLAAVLFDRRGLSMRTVALAATVILLLQPESLLGASFQLSFAAVVALIAAYEVYSGPRRRRTDGWPRRIGIYLLGVAVTTLIAGAATTPFAVFHFNRLAAFGLAANLLAVPVTALWVMPWAVVAFLLLPLGLERWALVPMGWGIDWVIGVAQSVATWPGAISLVPAAPVWGLTLVVFGGLWLCLWRGRWRLWGPVAIAAGFGSVLLIRPPDILIDETGRLAAMRGANGDFAVSSLRTARFSREVWLRRDGQEDEAVVWPAAGRGADGRLTCDILGCIYQGDRHLVAFSKRPEALIEDCRVADVVVSSVPVFARCPSAQVVVDRFDLWRWGAHALWLEEDGSVTVESVDGRRGDRPWVARRIRQSERRGEEPGTGS